MLDEIKSPLDIKRYSIAELQLLSDEIRNFLIDSISKTGGHIGANLGVVELTVALHYVFDAPADKIIFDTGHQGYTHKLLTGRKERFKTLNEIDGMSRFLSKCESPFDIIEASHAGTAIPIATGFALSNKLNNKKEYVIAFVGDGALVEGMSAEGLNFAVASNLPMIIVINDNGMSIPPNIGAIKNLFSGADWQEKSRAHFSGMGFRYIAVDDGHDLNKLISAFLAVKSIYDDGAIIVHVKTEKGRGLAIAKNHKYKLHFSMPFDPVTGQGSSPLPAGKSFAKVGALKLNEVMRSDSDVIAITPATPYASDLDQCLADFPERVIDVGMAEQQAMGLAAGLALAGKKPFVCYQSTFMQRAFDQIIHDACYMNLPITILCVRSGFAGFDGPTHHGIYDISYLRGLPNLKLFYPGHSSDLEAMIEARAKDPAGPMIILYPYENVPNDEDGYKEDKLDIRKPQVVYSGADGYILTVGNRLETALTLRVLLQESGKDFGVINIRWLKPLPSDWLEETIKKVPDAITLEENIIDAGFGSLITELICRNNLNCRIFCSAIEKDFIKAGDKKTLSENSGIDAQSIFQRLKNVWNLTRRT
jgi:1-deoxy-D-xylulose-5-phosphate synthase